MKSITSFQELAKLQAGQLAKQPPTTLEEARAQVKRLHEKSTSKNKKKRTDN